MARKTVEQALVRISKRTTMAQEAQRKHWETLGQLHAIKGLLIYMESTCTYTMQHRTIQHIRDAAGSIRRAIDAERENNEFINLNRTPAWKRGRK